MLFSIYASERGSTTNKDIILIFNMYLKYLKWIEV